MEWLKSFLANIYQPNEYKEEIESLKVRNQHLEDVYVDALDSENNYKNKASEAERRMLAMATLQNTDLVAEKANYAAKQINNLFVWSWKSPEQRTRALEILIEQLLIEQIKGTPAWTENTDKYKG